MSANDQKVPHYDSEYQHWDYALNVGMGCLEYAATKYLSRYQKKGQPVVDLEKVLHYTIKLRENATLVLTYAKCTRPNKMFIREETNRFCSINRIPSHANNAILGLAIWETPSELNTVIATICALIKIVKDSVDSGANPVPLEDSNKHSDRSSS